MFMPWIVARWPKVPLFGSRQTLAPVERQFHRMPDVNRDGVLERIRQPFKIGEDNNRQIFECP
jgi:hypothetical protein